MQFAKLVVFVNAAVPLFVLGSDLYFGNGRIVNSVEYALHTTGLLTLIFLMLTLAVTPLRKITGWNWLSNFRRMLGLYAFFYGCLHFIAYFAYDQSLSVSAVIADTVKRPFIFVGMAGLILMIPLAITSTNAMIKRLGGKRWKLLHKLVYVSAIAGVIHFLWLVKADKTRPMEFAMVLSMLLGYRILESQFAFLRRRPVARARNTPAAPSTPV
ncbi:MAG: sulfoxide reductase heme-binding subunit YedZ [Planctomycetota bacterium]|nr:sulfoxide reductase heme-binding subunit YedZ [Planctomycetota bacterium]